MSEVMSGGGWELVKGDTWMDLSDCVQQCSEEEALFVYVDKEQDVFGNVVRFVYLGDVVWC